MANVRPTAFRLSLLSPHLRGRGLFVWLALCPVALGCLPENGAGDTHESDGRVQEPAVMGSAADAALGADLDGASEHDALAQPAAEASSAAPTSDSGASDVGAGDSAASDSSVSDSGASDSGGRDGGASDGGAGPLDAQPGDASTADAQAPGGDAATPDASAFERGHSGEVRWAVTPTNSTNFPYDASGYCPDRRVSLWKEETIGVREPSATIFSCTMATETCFRPDNLDENSVTYLFQTDELEVHLTFSARILDGYSTEKFRQYLVQTYARWRAAPKAAAVATPVDYDDHAPTVEFVSYEAPILHARIRAETAQMMGGFAVKATTPYLCSHATPVGGWPTDFHECTEVYCSYAGEDPVQLVADMKIRIQQP